NDYEEEDAALQSVVKVHGHSGSQEPAWMRWTSTALAYFAAVVLGVASGYLFRDWQTARAMQGLSDRLAVCQQIEQHPVESCQVILRQFEPSLLAPAAAPVAPTAQASPTPSIQSVPTPSPEKPRHTSPQQEKAP